MSEVARGHVRQYYPLVNVVGSDTYPSVFLASLLLGIYNRQVARCPHSARHAIRRRRWVVSAQPGSAGAKHSRPTEYVHAAATGKSNGWYANMRTRKAGDAELLLARLPMSDAKPTLRMHKAALFAANLRVVHSRLCHAAPLSACSRRVKHHALRGGAGADKLSRQMARAHPANREGIPQPGRSTQLRLSRRGPRAHQPSGLSALKSHRRARMDPSSAEGDARAAVPEHAAGTFSSQLEPQVYSMVCFHRPRLGGKVGQRVSQDAHRAGAGCTAGNHVRHLLPATSPVTLTTHAST